MSSSLFFSWLLCRAYLPQMAAEALFKVSHNPLYFGVVAVFNLQIGAITPPVGTFLYIMVRVAKMKFEDVVKGVTRRESRSESTLY
jgi:TRAP-type C4-dicarboxylate transport system permease large subunit